MKQTIKLRNGELEVLATAGTPIRYYSCFGEDLLLSIVDAMEGKNPFVITKLAYIMARQAEGYELNQYSQDDFLRWADQFGGVELTEAVNDIINVYYGQTETKSHSKKKAN